MWLASKTGVFTYLCIFLAKEFGNQRNEKKRRKTKGEILKKVKDSIMLEEIASKDTEKTAKSVKSSDEAVEAVNNMEKIVKSNSNIY